MVRNPQVPLNAANLLPNSTCQGFDYKELLSYSSTLRAVMLLFVLILYKHLGKCLMNIIGIIIT
jgi:hypothetical protein